MREPSQCLSMRNDFARPGVAESRTTAQIAPDCRGCTSCGLTSVIFKLFPRFKHRDQKTMDCQCHLAARTGPVPSIRFLFEIVAEGSFFRVNSPPMDAVMTDALVVMVSSDSESDCFRSTPHSHAPRVDPLLFKSTWSFCIDAELQPRQPQN